MAKINLVDEVLKHTDEEIIEYVYGLASAIRRAYAGNENPVDLLKVSGQVEILYSVTRGLKERNDRLSDNNSL